jgi:hypothetical protein
MRVIQAGGKIWMSKSINSTYFSRGSLSKLWKQYFQYGFWRIRTLQKHKKPAVFRQLVPLLFVLSILLLGVSGIFWNISLYLLGIEVILYVLGLIVGSVDVGCKSGWQYAPVVPVVFIILHFAYGLGSIWGIVRFYMLKGWNLKRTEEFQISR